MRTKVKSFTLSELLVVMIITAIVVGMAFSVLRLVQKQISTIQKNYEKSTRLSLFEQKLWQDFNESDNIVYNKQNNSISLHSEIDTVVYSFQDDFVIRNKDSIILKVSIEKTLFEGNEVSQENIDAIAISGEMELPKYKIFVSKKNDITHSMNQEDDF